MRKVYYVLTAAFLTTFSQLAQAQMDSTEVAVEEDFFELSLEDLLNMEVTSVSKKAERLQDVTSSLYVITAEDIKNSGATTLHEVLRLVPGYWGTQTEYNNVDPLIRNSPTANGSRGTVLYLLDGTPIQDNMSSSFTFANFDIPLDEIDRIEVIRGSGGTVYGANSATGVVNIFTKSPDKYDGMHARVDYASPGYTNVTLRGGAAINDKLSLSAYGKVRHFQGFGRVDGFEGDVVNVPVNEDSTTYVFNRFDSDYETSLMISGGLKVGYALSDKTKISLNTHYNTASQTTYTNYETSLTLLGFGDVLVENNVNRSRFVGNLRVDQEFSENHSLFARVSTNRENDFLPILGGIDVNNSIVDFEVQDNLSLGSMNDLSFGANYRIVTFDVSGVNDPEGVGYINPQNTEQLNGFFIQDKVKLLEGKLNFLLGAKAENYSLINDKYYLSPMAKFSVIPHESVTIWGGYTRSYTTPGYNNTNIDLILFKAPPIAIPGLKNNGLINGSETVPTQYSTFELGLRTNMEGMFAFESNFYYSDVEGGIAPSTSAVLVDYQSPTRPGVTGDYFYYGNYVQGFIYGLESLIKIIPTADARFEISHVYTEAEWEYQANGDFDVNLIPEEDRDLTPETRLMPKHVVRMRGIFSLPKNMTFSADMIYATKYKSQGTYDYVNQRNPSVIFGGGLETGVDQSRTIINLKLSKSMLEDKLNVYIFGNDIFNEGIIANTNTLAATTLSQIAGMYGIGLDYQFK